MHRAGAGAGDGESNTSWNSGGLQVADFICTEQTEVTLTQAGYQPIVNPCLQWHHFVMLREHLAQNNKR